MYKILCTIYMNSRHYRYNEKVELHLKKKQIIETPGLA